MSQNTSSGLDLFDEKASAVRGFTTVMRGYDKIAVAVRQPDGKIVVDVNPVSSVSDRYPILKKPLLRGVVAEPIVVHNQAAV